MAKYALINEGIVERVIVADSKSLEKLCAHHECEAAKFARAIDVTELPVGAGHLYDAEKGTFTAPTEPEEPATLPTPQEQIDELRAKLEELEAKQK